MGIPMVAGAAVEEREMGRERGRRGGRDGVDAGTARLPGRPNVPSLEISVVVGRPEGRHTRQCTYTCTCSLVPSPICGRGKHGLGTRLPMYHAYNHTMYMYMYMHV